MAVYFYHDVGKCKPIFRVLSLTDSERNWLCLFQIFSNRLDFVAVWLEICQWKNFKARMTLP